jgi:hypothetical protein
MVGVFLQTTCKKVGSTNGLMNWDLQVQSTDPKHQPTMETQEATDKPEEVTLILSNTLRILSPVHENMLPKSILSHITDFFEHTLASPLHM